MVKIDPPSEFEGVSLNGYPQYQADVMRLKILYEQGGMYFDTDCILMKPVSEFLLSDAVVCGEGVWINNATLFTPKGNPFFAKWISRLADGLKTGIWERHANNLPADIYAENSTGVQKLPKSYFLPFDWDDRSILNVGGSDKAFRNSHVIHLWETMWSGDLKSVDVEYIERKETPLAKILSTLIS